MMHTKKGFTLIELLVVIVIIGILAGIGVSQYNSFIARAKAGKAKAEMAQIVKAIRAMEVETGKTIGYHNIDDCKAVNKIVGYEYSMSDCAGGLLCETGSPVGNNIPYEYDFGSNWFGPYIEESVLTDPWGTPYIFDYDFICTGTQFKDKECEGLGRITAITSAGPDKDMDEYEDNVMLPYCLPN